MRQNSKTRVLSAQIGAVDSTHPSIFQIEWIDIERFVKKLAIVKKIFTNFAKGFDAPQWPFLQNYFNSFSKSFYPLLIRKPTNKQSKENI